MTDKTRTTIGIKTSTKDKLHDNKAPGQCYDGFICQLVDLWEKANGNNESHMVINTSESQDT